MVSGKAVYGVLVTVAVVDEELVQGAVELVVQAVFHLAVAVAVQVVKYLALGHQQVQLEDEARLESGLIKVV